MCFRPAFLPRTYQMGGGESYKKYHLTFRLFYATIASHEIQGSPNLSCQKVATQGISRYDRSDKERVHV